MKRFFYTIAFCLSFSGTALYAQNVGVNSDSSLPHPSAMLDVKSSNKGFLAPRVSLASITDVATISAPAAGLLVYNTNASMQDGDGSGYYYYNGSKWIRCGNDTQQMILGLWHVNNYEQELYSNNTMTTKLMVPGQGSTITFNSNLTYNSNYQNTTFTSGVWQLLSSGYIVFDKNTAGERYYHILVISTKNLVLKGPFDVNGNIIPSLNYVLQSYNVK
jgi:hypothetical protein